MVSWMIHRKGRYLVREKTFRLIAALNIIEAKEIALSKIKNNVILPQVNCAWENWPK